MTQVALDPFPVAHRDEVLAAILAGRPAALPDLAGNYSAERGFELPLTDAWRRQVTEAEPQKADLLAYHQARQLRFRVQGDQVVGLRSKDDLPYWTPEELIRIKAVVDRYSTVICDPLSIYQLVLRDDWDIFELRFPARELSPRRAAFYQKYGLTGANDVIYGLLTREIAVLQDRCETLSPGDFFNLCGHIEKRYTRTAQRRCQTCKATEPVLRKCGACRQVRYCSVACQHQDWFGHRATCRAPV